MPESTPGAITFHERMRFLEGRFKSRSQFARAAGLSQSGFQRYFDGGEPTLSALLAIAQAAGVGIKWLATGSGSPDEDLKSAAGGGLDLQLLTECLMIAEQATATVAELGQPASTEEKIELATSFYDTVSRLRAEGKPIEVLITHLRELGNRKGASIRQPSDQDQRQPLKRPA